MDNLPYEQTLRLESLKFATNYFCSGAGQAQPKGPDEVVALATKFFDFVNGTSKPKKKR